VPGKRLHRIAEPLGRRSLASCHVQDG
jgi:hypothetical protein